MLVEYKFNQQKESEMNHIFKTVSNKALGRVMVTSELAKTNVVGSSGTSKKVYDSNGKLLNSSGLVDIVNHQYNFI